MNILEYCSSLRKAKSHEVLRALKKTNLISNPNIEFYILKVYYQFEALKIIYLCIKIKCTIFLMYFKITI